MILIQTGGELITLDQEANWQGASPALLEKLEAVSSGFEPSGADPQPYLTLAQEVVRQLGGQIVQIVEEADDPSLPPRVYSSGL